MSTARALLALSIMGLHAFAQEPWFDHDPNPHLSVDRDDYPPFLEQTTFWAERSRAMADALRNSVLAPGYVRDAVVQHVGQRLAFDGRVLMELGGRDAFRFALAAGDCRQAEAILWRRLIEAYPYLSGFKDEPHFQRLVRWRVYGVSLLSFLPEELRGGDMLDLRPLAACLSRQAATEYAAMIATWARTDRSPEDLLRPFSGFPMLINAVDSLHALRDGNYWHLVHLATQAEGGGYGPAGLMFVELALRSESINVPDDILHMLLLRARSTWPELDAERPIPETTDQIAELLPITAARLGPDERARAERCFLTNEPYDRLFLGEAVYFGLPEEEQCAPVEP